MCDLRKTTTRGKKMRAYKRGQVRRRVAKGMSKKKKSVRPIPLCGIPFVLFCVSVCSSNKHTWKGEELVESTLLRH